MMFAQPSFLVALLLVPLLTLVCLASWRKRRAILDRLAAVGMLEQLVGGNVQGRRAAQAVFAVLAVGGIALAASGPRWGFEWQQQRMEGVTIAVVLDTSRSMDAQDISPSRMEFSRRKLDDFTNMLRGDSVGLVIFAAGAYLRLPPTVDYDTFRWSLDDSDTSTIRSQGTSLAGALDVATRMLDRAGGSGKALLLVSDGEAHDDKEAVDAAVAKAAAAGVHIYALGVGTPDGAPIPLSEGGFKKDASGNLVVSKLDEDRLKALASATGGAYVRAVASEDDVRTLYETEIRGKLQANERGVRQEKLWHERYQWPLALGLGCALVSAAMSIGLRKFSSQKAALLVLLLLPMVAWAGAASDGLTAWKSGDWQKAIPLLGQARVEDPGNREVARALAESLYRTGRFREAESMFQSLADTAGNDKERAVYAYNAGNAAYRAGRLNEAVQDFQQSYAKDPGFTAAKQNGDLVQQELAMRLKQQPPPQQDQQQQQPQDQQQDQQQQAANPQDPSNQPQDQQQNQQSQQQQQDQQAQQQQQDPQGKHQQPQDQTTGQQSQQQDPQAQQDPSEVQQGDGTPAQEAESGDPDKMTKEQAAQLVDSVQDGKPRVALGGASSGRDW